MNTLREIIMQKTDQWHRAHPVHLIEKGILVSKPQSRSFDESPVYKMFMQSVEEWLSQDRSFAKPNGPTAQELLKELEE